MSSKVSVLDALELLGLEPPQTVPGHISSPNRSDSEPSLWIQPDHWYDFGDGVGGDSIDLVRYVTGCSYVKAVQYLSSALGDLDDREYVAPQKRVVIDFTDEFAAETWACDKDHDDAVEFFKEKWPHLRLNNLLSDDVVSIGNRRLLVPHWSANNRTYGVKYRTLDGKKMSFKGSTFTDRLYRVEERRPEHVHFALAEGESDAWTLHYAPDRPAHVHVLALPSGASVIRPEFITELESYVYGGLHLDPDDAGFTATQKITRALEINKKTNWSDESKFITGDVTEAYLNHLWRPRW